MPPLRSAGTGPEAEDPEYAGRYRLEARLGSGGMGVVHLARSDSGLRLAVKVVHADFAADPEFRARFRQEVAAARRVSGAYTAPVVDADPDGGRPWMATLYIPGPTLAEHVKRNGPLEPDEVLQLAAGLAEALRDIHRADVVHRDLKPSNVLLAADGPKVIDFGISRPADSDLRTETGKLIGTPPFMAPEQFQRPRQVGPAADVFALGSVLVHAATGSGPFDSDSPYIVAYQVVHDEANLAGVPDTLVPLIRRCLAKDPADRPTPDALMAALRALRGPYAPAPRGPLPRVPAQRHGGGGPGAPAAGPDREPAAGADVGAGVGPGGGASPAGGAGGAAPGDRADDGRRGGGGLRSAGEHAAGDDGQGGGPDGGRAGGRDGGSRGEGRSWGRRPGPLRAVRGRLALVLGLVVLLGSGVVWTLRQIDTLQPTARQRPAGGTTEPHPAWQTPLDQGTDGGPLAAYCSYGRGALYCAAPGGVTRLDPERGRVVWSRPATGPARPENGAPTPPVLSGGLVQVLSPDGTRLEALDPDTHRLRWHRDVSDYGGRVYRAGGTVLLVRVDGTVTGIDAATGKQRWRHRVAGHQLPAFFAGSDGRTAYAYTVAGDGTRTLVSALDPVRGTTRWERRLTGGLTPVGTGPDEVLHLAGTDAQSRTDAVVRYDPRDGVERRTPLATPVAATSVTSHDDVVYVLSGDGGLLAVDTRPTGTGDAQLWRLETSVGNASPLLATADRVYFSAADGRLLAVDAVEGELLGQTPLRPGKGGQGFADTLPAPVVADGRVVGSAPDGTVFGVDERTPRDW
ncbi:PQQ-binding-like beta-propeller repeat protein [Streptomyces pactum]|uniref:PQQ-binding-like beta-propeller repeat protein n=1 Tax=Streptomyces pactum TaxID=68249 RepID=A0ABS0NKM9_9ACTN|nr:serine/threonine-protein kinase [Streptomyces pactum]MBH5335659.1 PQQ-binding-like beta-propeller repeat protein [Streptomyces pactum]